MLLYWFFRLFGKIKWLLVKPQAIDVAKIDENRVCAVCGAREGRLRAVHANVSKNTTPDVRVFCQHTCLKCGGRSFEDPVGKVNKDLILPAIARDDLERHEDSKNYGRGMAASS